MLPGVGDSVGSPWAPWGLFGLHGAPWGGGSVGSMGLPEVGGSAGSPGPPSSHCLVSGRPPPPPRYPPGIPPPAAPAPPRCPPHLHGEDEGQEAEAADVPVQRRAERPGEVVAGRGHRRGLHRHHGAPRQPLHVQPLRQLLVGRQRRPQHSGPVHASARGCGSTGTRRAAGGGRRGRRHLGDGFDSPAARTGRDVAASSGHCFPGRRRVRPHPARLFTAFPAPFFAPFFVPFFPCPFLCPILCLLFLCSRLCLSPLLLSSLGFTLLLSLPPFSLPPFSCHLLSPLFLCPLLISFFASFFPCPPLSPMLRCLGSTSISGCFVKKH